MTLDIRRYEPDSDREAVLRLCEAGLGWRRDDPNHLLFRWKHEQNAFGPSAAWVAEDRGRLVGFRAFLRWEFSLDGEVVRAVRAVDTVTLPDARGKGVFRSLTLTGLEELAAEGVAFVFNTPNNQSRPGYLKMGWQLVGHLPTLFRPRGLLSGARLARARVAASHWSTPTTVGRVAVEIPQIAVPPHQGRLVTRRSDAYHRWRYGADFLGYRTQATDGGQLVFRLRHRGAALEAAIADCHGSPARGSEVVRLLRETRADYALALAGPGRPGGLVPLPRLGPLLTWKGLQGDDMPPLSAWGLSLGDIELF